METDFRPKRILHNSQHSLNLSYILALYWYVVYAGHHNLCNTCVQWQKWSKPYMYSMPTLLFGSENWIVSGGILEQLDSFIGELTKSLKWPKHFSHFGEQRRGLGQLAQPPPLFTTSIMRGGLSPPCPLAYAVSSEWWDQPWSDTFWECISMKLAWTALPKNSNSLCLNCPTHLSCKYPTHLSLNAPPI